MSRENPQAGCTDLRLERPLRLTEAGEVALEDYARTLTGSEKADTFSGPAGLVLGIHLCQPSRPLSPEIRKDLEDFGKGLVEPSGSGGLGWS